MPKAGPEEIRLASRFVRRQNQIHPTASARGSSLLRNWSMCCEPATRNLAPCHGYNRVSITHALVSNQVKTPCRLLFVKVSPLAAGWPLSDDRPIEEVRCCILLVQSRIVAGLCILLPLALLSVAAFKIERALGLDRLFRRGWGRFVNHGRNLLAKQHFSFGFLGNQSIRIAGGWAGLLYLPELDRCYHGRKGRLDFRGPQTCSVRR